MRFSDFSFARTLIFFLALLFLTACGSKQVQYLDSKEVTVTYLQEMRKGDYLVLRLGFQGDSSSVYHSIYRVDWLDKDGQVVDSTSWRPIIVRGGLMVHATEQAMIPGVISYTVIVSNRSS